MASLRNPLLTGAVVSLTVLLSACVTTGNPIASTYESSFGCCGPFPAWLVPHSGVDFTGQFGEDVIAPADGTVATDSWANPQTCGNAVAIHHAEFNRYTVFCHFQDVSVKVGQRIKRGEKIGTLGDSGVAGGCRQAGRPCAIVHMELNTDGIGHPRAIKGLTFDVLEYSVGCFDSGSSYPTDKLALTYPVRCQTKPQKVAADLPNSNFLGEPANLALGSECGPLASRQH